MAQKGLNERIAMSLLMQCAWMWEYCTRNPNEGEFRLGDVVQGLTARNRTNTKPGWIMVEMTLCERWEHFAEGIDGLKYFDRRTGEVTLWFGDFHCSYLLTNIFSITKAFCQANACQSLMNKTIFGYKDGERWCRIEKRKVKSEKPSARTTPTIQSTPTIQTATPLSLADRLREALRARLAQAA